MTAPDDRQVRILLPDCGADIEAVPLTIRASARRERGTFMSGT